MKRISILVCSDAGAAGRNLLARRDVELQWALTAKEAVAALARKKPRMVLAREEFILPLLQSSSQLLRRVPVVVLLDHDGWTRRAEYFAAGATALVSAQSDSRIMEAVCELTGLPTSHAPRIPYTEVVDVNYMGDQFFLESVDLGSTGMSIRDFPPARTGDRVEAGLVMMEPTLVVSGMVIRSYLEHGSSVTAITFNALDGQERATLQHVVEQERRKLAPMPEPVGLTNDLSGTFTLDLFQAVAQGQEEADRYVKMLRSVFYPSSDGQGPKVPRWLARVGRSLTEVEQRALLGQETPAFALAAIEMRIDLARSRAVSLTEVPAAEECELALDFCRSLATDADAAAPEDLAQVSQIRAALLRSVYGASVARPRKPDPVSHGEAMPTPQILN